MSNINKRLTQFRQSIKFSQAKIANFCGVTTAAWQKYEKDKYPKSDIVLKLTELDLSPDWLFLGRESNNKLSMRDSWCLSDSVKDSDYRIYTVQEIKEGLYKKFQEVDSRLGYDSYISLSTDFLKNSLKNPNFCLVFRMQGNSMAPNIPNNAICITDITEVKNIIDDKVYIFIWEEEIFIRKLQKINPYTLLVSSFNNEIPHFSLDLNKKKLKIIGTIKCIIYDT